MKTEKLKKYKMDGIKEENKVLSLWTLDGAIHQINLMNLFRFREREREREREHWLSKLISQSLHLHHIYAFSRCFKVDYKRGAKTFIKEPTIVAVHNAVY